VEARSYDVVLFLYVLHHAADERVLRDDGCLLIAEDSVDGLWNSVLTVGFHIFLGQAKDPGSGQCPPQFSRL